MKNSFILYHSYRKHLKLLTNEQKGILLDAIFDYSEKGTVTPLEPILEMALNFIIEDIDINKEKWEARAEASRENGKLGGRPSVKPKEPTKPTRLSSNLDKPRKPVSVSVSVSGNVSVKDNRENISVDTTAKAVNVSDYERFISGFNKITNSKFKGDSKSKKQYLARRKEGFTHTEIGMAILEASKDNFLNGDNDRETKYLTPEFITRPDKLSFWLEKSRNK